MTAPPALLVVLPLVPYPPDQGDRLRAWDMLRDLAGLGPLRVVLVGPELPGETARAALAGLGATVAHVGLGRADLAAGALAAVARGWPASVGAFWSPLARRALLAAAPGPWDLAVAFQLRAAWYVQAVPARRRALELTDSLSLYAGRLPWRGRALRQRLLLQGARRLERDLPRRFDLCFVSTDDDADAVAALAGARPVVVPNGCHPVADPAPPRPAGPLLFVGNMRYPPNEDGILWFVRTVRPALRQAFPDLRLRVVDRSTPRVEALAHGPGVEVRGYVEDLRAEVDAALALVNPIRFGSGSNRKALDGLAAGRPVVSTRMGGRGIGAGEEDGLLRADAPAEWVRAVGRLRAAPARRRPVAPGLGRAAWRPSRGRGGARACAGWGRRAEAARSPGPGAAATRALRCDSRPRAHRVRSRAISGAYSQRPASTPRTGRRPCALWSRSLPGVASGRPAA